MYADVMIYDMVDHGALECMGLLVVDMSLCRLRSILQLVNFP